MKKQSTISQQARKSSVDFRMFDAFKNYEGSKIQFLSDYFGIPTSKIEDVTNGEGYNSFLINWRGQSYLILEQKDFFINTINVR